MMHFMAYKKVALIGGFHEIIELCEACSVEVVGIIDNKLQNEYCGIPVLGSDLDAEKLYASLKNIPLVVTPDQPQIRKKIVDLYARYGYKFMSLISPQAFVSKSVDIGVGTIIQAGVNVSSCTKIGDFCKLNTYSNVMHDNIVGNYVTMAPNAVSLGYVVIEDFSYIGANSTILPQRIVGANSIVGAGAVVTKDVMPNNVVAGVPAKVLSK